MVNSSSAVSAVTLEEAKTHLRLDHKAEDTLIEALCLTCTQLAEHELQRPLITRGEEVGYGVSPEDVPVAIRQWILLHVGTYYVQRESSSTVEVKLLSFVDHLLDPYRNWGGDDEAS